MTTRFFNRRAAVFVGLVVSITATPGAAQTNDGNSMELQREGMQVLESGIAAIGGRDAILAANTVALLVQTEVFALGQGLRPDADAAVGDGGPSSTPAIHGDMVYALGPRGQFVALGLADGKKVWSKMLPADFGSQEPDYGFTTSPLMVGGDLPTMDQHSLNADAALPGVTVPADGSPLHRPVDVRVAVHDRAGVAA